jgi:signal transduction histidine kinase
LTTDAQGVKVEVQDNGGGVPEEQQALIFEKFRQGGEAAHRPQGTGLGLPISHQIVKHFGGRLWLRSGPGQGACFAFELPWSHDQDRASTVPGETR